MNLQAIVIANGFGLSLMLMLLICAGKDIRRNDFSEKVFTGMIFATMALCTLETASFLVDGHLFPGARALGYLFNTLTFSINIVCVYLWALFIDFKLYEDTARIRRRCVWIAVPALLELCLLLANLFTPIFFSISPENVYSRTPLTVFAFLNSFLYLGCTEWLIYKSRSNATRYLFLPSVIFLLPLLVGSVLQMLFYGLSLIWAALSISVVSVYLNIQSMYSSVDSLSGVYTRQYFDGWLAARAHAGHRPLAGAMIDLDRFKAINDSFGHLAGDQAIRDFGRLLRVTAGRHDVIARYGGDEFVLVREGGQEAGLQALMRRLEDAVRAYNETGKEPFHLSFSAGYGVFLPEETDLDAFLKRIDSSMYESKKEKSCRLPDRRAARP